MCYLHPGTHLSAELTDTVMGEQTYPDVNKTARRFTIGLIFWGFDLLNTDWQIILIKHMFSHTMCQFSEYISQSSVKLFLPPSQTCISHRNRTIGSKRWLLEVIPTSSPMGAWNNKQLVPCHITQWQLIVLLVSDYHLPIAWCWRLSSK